MRHKSAICASAKEFIYYFKVRTIMGIKISIILLLISVCFSLELEFEGEQTNYEWLILNRDDIAYYLSYENEKTDSVMHKLKYLWTRKIDLEGREIAQHFAQVLIKYPEKLIPWFAEKSIELDGFVHDLPSNLFADMQEEDPKSMEKLKADLIKGLKDYLKKKPAKKNAEVARRILKRVEESEIIVKKKE
jgi:hypothetical protein